MKRLTTLTTLLLMLLMLLPGLLFAQDWYEATGKPVQRGPLNSADLRTEFASIETDIADKLPALTGNGGKIIAVNSGGTALEALAAGVPLASGGTGATTAAGARTNLGVAIGSDVQAWDADLDSLAGSTFAGLAKADGNFLVADGSDWTVESGASARSSLGLGSLASLSSIDNANWSGTDLAVANGGTGASTASDARTNLGLGSLATQSTINGGDWSGTDLAVANGGTGASTAADARSNLGAAAASHNHSASDITSGTLAVSRGGTGQTTMDNVSEQVTLQWTIQSDPGGTPSGSPGDVFAYY